MPKLYGLVSEVLNRPDLTVKSLPWAKAPFISRLGFEKGKTPPHLAPVVEKLKSEKGKICKGRTGFVVYKGRRMPAAIVCLAENVRKIAAETGVSRKG